MHNVYPSTERGLEWVKSGCHQIDQGEMWNFVYVILFTNESKLGRFTYFLLNSFDSYTALKFTLDFTDC